MPKDIHPLMSNYDGYETKISREVLPLASVVVYRQIAVSTRMGNPESPCLFMFECGFPSGLYFMGKAGFSRTLSQQHKAILVSI